MKRKWLLFIIILLAAALRLYKITSVPPSLNWDEVSLGYNAYSILETGKDEWGESYPLIFKAYGDYKLPVYIYTTAASIGVFGLNEFAVRFPSVIAGIITVGFTYLIARELLKDEIMSMLSAFLVSIEPWSLFLSRAAFEANLSVALIVSGVYFFLRGLKRYKFLMPSSILLGLSVWTYNSARVFVPLFVFSLIIIYRKSLVKALKSKTTKKR